MSDTKEVLFGLYDDEQDLLKAVQEANNQTQELRIEQLEADEAE